MKIKKREIVFAKATFGQIVQKRNKEKGAYGKEKRMKKICFMVIIGVMCVALMGCERQESSNDDSEYSEREVEEFLEELDEAYQEMLEAEAEEEQERRNGGTNAAAGEEDREEEQEENQQEDQEKENVAADLALCDEIQTAVMTAMMDPEVHISNDPAVQQAILNLENETDIYSLLSGTDLFTETVKYILDIDSVDELTLRSHNASGVLPVSAIRIRCVLEQSGDNNYRMEKCAVWIEGSDASGLQGADPEKMQNISVGQY